VKIELVKTKLSIENQAWLCWWCCVVLCCCQWQWKSYRDM